MQVSRNRPAVLWCRVRTTTVVAGDSCHAVSRRKSFSRARRVLCGNHVPSFCKMLDGAIAVQPVWFGPGRLAASSVGRSSSFAEGEGARQLPNKAFFSFVRGLIHSAFEQFPFAYSTCISGYGGVLADETGWVRLAFILFRCRSAQDSHRVLPGSDFLVHDWHVPAARRFL